MAEAERAQLNSPRNPGTEPSGGGTQQLVGISLVEGILFSLFNLFSDGFMGLSLALSVVIVGWVILPIAILFKVLIWLSTMAWLIMRKMWRGTWAYGFSLALPFQTPGLWAAIAMNNAFIKKLTGASEQAVNAASGSPRSTSSPRYAGIRVLRAGGRGLERADGAVEYGEEPTVLAGKGMQFAGKGIAGGTQFARRDFETGEASKKLGGRAENTLDAVRTGRRPDEKPLKEQENTASSL